MAKRVCPSPEWLKASQVSDIYSVSGCVNDDFGDYIQFEKHNGYWLFNSPSDIAEVAETAGFDLAETSLFYYEVHPEELDGESWVRVEPEKSVFTEVIAPKEARLEGFDVVTVTYGKYPECSPLSCNSMAAELPTNSHCLFATFEDAWDALNRDAFKDCEPGPYRIFGVYSTGWT
jgi:hypothetical protein